MLPLTSRKKSSENGQAMQGKVSVHCLVHIKKHPSVEADITVMLAMPQEWMTTTSIPSLIYIKQKSSNCTMQLAGVWHRSTESSLATAELVRMKYQTVSVVTESLKVTCHFSLVRMVTEPTLAH